MCKTALLGVVHHPNNKLYFESWIPLLSSGKRGVGAKMTENLSAGPHV
jgi:hypothetical protein